MGLGVLGLTRVMFLRGVDGAQGTPAHNQISPSMRYTKIRVKGVGLGGYWEISVLGLGFGHVHLSLGEGLELRFEG